MLIISVDVDRRNAGIPVDLSARPWHCEVYIDIIEFELENLDSGLSRVCDDDQSSRVLTLECRRVSPVVIESIKSFSSITREKKKKNNKKKKRQK